MQMRKTLNWSQLNYGANKLHRTLVYCYNHVFFLPLNYQIFVNFYCLLECVYLNCGEAHLNVLSMLILFGVRLVMLGSVVDVWKVPKGVDYLEWEEQLMLWICEVFCAWWNVPKALNALLKRPLLQMHSFLPNSYAK